MFNKLFAILLLVLIACSAPTIQAEPVPKPVHGRAVNEIEFMQLVVAAAMAMSTATDHSGSCLGNVEQRPEACAEKAVRYADALAVELRRSGNWPQ